MEAAAKLNWNDDRFDRFEAKFDERLDKVDARFEHLHERLEKRFDLLTYAMIVTLAGFLAAFAGLFASTHL
jgi:hypothetical protein